MIRFSLSRPITLILLLTGLSVIVFTARAQMGCPAPAVSDAIRLRVEPREDNRLIADAFVDLAAAAPVYVEYGSDQLGWLRTPTSPLAASQALPIVHLRGESSYQLRAFALVATGCPAAFAAAQFTTRPLPPELRRFRRDTVGRSGYPLTLTDARVSLGDYAWLLILDQDGEVVWYYPIPPEVLRNAGNRRAYGVRKLRNGDFIYLGSRWGLEEVSPDARVVRRIRAEATEIHHDLTELPDGRILFIGAEVRPVDTTARGGPPDLPVLGGTLNLLDLETGVYQRVWGTFDVLDPNELHPQLEAYQATDPPYGNFIDWNHMNSVVIGARGNVIVSLRHLDQILSLSPDFRTLEWRLGGRHSDFDFPNPSDRFYGQHAVTETPEGHILMFDNGNFRPEGEYSRGLELELDLATMTARRVWEYRHQPDIYGVVLGSVFATPQGNRIVNFGFRSDETDPEAPIALVEARPDGTEVWQHWTSFKGARTVRYRANPIDSIAGEQSVEPTAIAP